MKICHWGPGTDWPRLAVAFGEVILDDGREYTGLFTETESDQRECACRVHAVGVPSDTRQGFLDALKVRDRHFELFADTRVGTGE